MKSTPVLRATVAVALVLAAFGCSAVPSTAVYYIPATLDTRPPKPKDAEIPIISNPPKRPHEVIGRLAFETTQGFGFMRESMVYNARQNGADAVVLNRLDERTETFVTRVPSSWDYVPYTQWMPYTVKDKKGKTQTYYNSYTNWMPVFRPGYTVPQSVTFTSIDADMIAFETPNEATQPTEVQ